MFVINFSPNAVIPYVEQGQLSGLGWELGSLRKGGWLQILHQPGLWPPCPHPSLQAASQMSSPSGSPFLSLLLGLSLFRSTGRVFSHSRVAFSLCSLQTFSGAKPNARVRFRAQEITVNEPSGMG